MPDDHFVSDKYKKFGQYDNIEGKYADHGLYDLYKDIRSALLSVASSAPGFIGIDFTQDGTVIMYVYAEQVKRMSDVERVSMGEKIKQMQRICWERGVPGGRSGLAGWPPRKVNGAE